MEVADKERRPEALLESPPPGFSEDDAAALARRIYGIAADATLLTSERDQNFGLTLSDGSRFLLKIANSAEDIEALQFENTAMRHIAAVAPNFPVARVILTEAGDDIVAVEHNGRSHQVRMISWLPGRLLHGVSTDPMLRRQLGAALAEMGIALRGLFHPAEKKHLLWDITNTVRLVDWVRHVDDPGTRTLCAEIIEEFEESVLPRLAPLRAQVIHNDFNPSNVLVSHEDPPSVTGVLDFGDMVHGPLVCDVAVGATYHSSPDRDSLEGVVDFVAGYHAVYPLEPAEIDLIYDLVCARRVTTIVITAWRSKEYPENRDYILRNATEAGESLRKLREIGRNEATNRLHRACQPVRAPRNDHASSADLAVRRDKLLGPAYRLFYKEPVHITRGEGVWLYDAHGNAYLDVYNNVPLVGHCHPKVVRALSEQAATLNTHTRYLHETVLDYAEELLALFPEELDRAMFSCTGTEANELALRIARACTGNTGVIVSERAYHGNSTAIAALSPSYEHPEGRVNWVETIPPPDTYRNDPQKVPGLFLTNLDAAIERFAIRGIRPAALLLDVGFTSDGMFIAPDSCLSAAASRIREAGGLFIGDEVQSGFARLGTTLWGFEAHGVVPDIVTLGKPIGNGHPLAATIARQDLLDAFATQSRYFNTFGGNPVSAAVGQAVLQAFREDGLEKNARQTGAYLHERLAALQDKFEVIGHVRGSGLFAGVELVTDRGTKEPATELTTRVVNDMRRNRILISMIGPHANVLKIRPPLPFQPKHVDHLVDALMGTFLI